ncbi:MULTISPECIES: CsbD family protein [Micromonospora]|uniref:CsbD family protein n=1 Tax=Micromonospora solifontis TaxID=2487138 RepID=A0ABX9WF69_9ACTN|nr:MULTISPECIES: CsbD family protein [Micromonospora]NES13593.1 CsbD family protein [Micromonospora sp. PPF5-17B]NES37295.1 CsbD family protein [Micromonospora solifontis]NES55441.1 CsbD family protein [Micromonospora sp. PPF5-6]RNL98526.1 CsbD family protein [Micromonospora solifontis]
MSFTDKAKAKAQELSGAAKERIGDVTDNERLRAEGASEQSTARARQVGQDVKQAGRDVKGAFEK